MNNLMKKACAYLVAFLCAVLMAQAQAQEREPFTGGSEQYQLRLFELLKKEKDERGYLTQEVIQQKSLEAVTGLSSAELAEKLRLAKKILAMSQFYLNTNYQNVSVRVLYKPQDGQVRAVNYNINACFTAPQKSEFSINEATGNIIVDIQPRTAVYGCVTVEQHIIDPTSRIVVTTAHPQSQAIDTLRWRRVTWGY